MNRNFRKRVGGGLSMTAAVSVLLAPLSGCGGGGGGGSASAAAPPTTRLLTPMPGQTWTYQATGSFSSEGVTTRGSGTFTDTYNASDLDGATIESDIVGSLNAGSLSIPLDTSTLLAVDSAGNLNAVGVEFDGSPVPQILATPILYVPGTFSPSFSFSGGSAIDNSNSSYSYSFKVAGTATITVPAGTYNTWVVTATIVQGATTSNETFWYAPEIGNFVKSTITGTNTTAPKSTLSVTAELVSTNVAATN